MKTVLVTGGLGFVGTNLVKRLVSEEYEVSVIDNLSAGTANFSSKVQFSHLDISNSEKVNSFFFLTEFFLRHIWTRTPL